MGRGRDIEILVDGRPVTAVAGETVLEAARRAGGDVPALCGGDPTHHAHSCRICLVEVDDGDGPRRVTACDTPVREGQRICTRGDGLERLRATALELHLAADPSDRRVRDLARAAGVVDRGRLRSSRRGDACVMCGLCPGRCLDLESPGPDLARAAWSACVAIGRVRSDWGGERPCRYALMGLVPGALCSHDYDCRTCPFDHEMLDRSPGEHPASLLPGRRARR